MFERVERIQSAIERVYRATEGLDRGGILTHDVIRGILGVEPHEGSWDHVVNRVRARMERERGIATWQETGVGYKLLTEVEQLHVGQWRERRAYRQIRRGRRSLEALPDAGLSLNQRKAKAMQIQQYTERLRSIRKDLKQQKALMALRPVTPRRPEMKGGAR